MKKLSKQLYSSYVGCVQWRGKRCSGYEIWRVSCRMGGVGTGVLLLCAVSRLIYLDLRFHLLFVQILYNCSISVYIFI